MPGGGPQRRLTPLRSGNIRWLKALRGKKTLGPPATQWASCNKNVTQVQFTYGNLFVPSTNGGLFLSNGDLAALGFLTLPIFAFVSFPVTGYTLGSHLGSAIGIVQVPNIPGAISAALIAAGIKAPSKTAFTNFKRPCSDPGGN